LTLDGRKNTNTEGGSFDATRLTLDRSAVFGDAHVGAAAADSENRTWLDAFRGDLRGARRDRESRITGRRLGLSRPWGARQRSGVAGRTMTAVVDRSGLGPCPSRADGGDEGGHGRRRYIGARAGVRVTRRDQPGVAAPGRRCGGHDREIVVHVKAGGPEQRPCSNGPSNLALEPTPLAGSRRPAGARVAAGT
jgi:hypothetical protein